MARNQLTKVRGRRKPPGIALVDDALSGSERVDLSVVIARARVLNVKTVVVDVQVERPADHIVLTFDPEKETE